VVGHSDPAFAGAVANAPDHTEVIDLVRLSGELEARNGYSGISW
jgi:hypothetical protein